MGASSQAEAKPLLLVDDPPWPVEDAAEDAVLAEFADESALGTASASPTSSPAPNPVAREYAGRQRRMIDMVRTLVLGCLSAMALGASFAIGFGYVWSDRSALRTTPAAEETAVPAPRPYVPGWWLPVSKAPGGAKEPNAAAPPPTAARSPTVPATPTKASAASKTADAPATVEGEPSSAMTHALDARPVEGDVALAAPLAAAPAQVVEPSLAPVIERPSVLPSRPAEYADTRGVIPVPSKVLVPPSAAAPMPSLNRGDVDAVRQTIALYQSAYSQMDVGAMAAVWPSLDTASVERAFAGIDRQALTLQECRVTTAGNLATAVCPGLVRYVGRVGSRHLQERHGIWTIALERRGDAWELVRLNVR